MSDSCVNVVASAEKALFMSIVLVEVPTAQYESTCVQSDNSESVSSEEKKCESQDVEIKNPKFFMAETSMVVVIEKKVLIHLKKQEPSATTISNDVVNPGQLDYDNMKSLVFCLPCEDGNYDVSDVTSSKPSAAFDIIQNGELNEENVWTDVKPKLFSRLVKLWKRKKQDDSSTEHVELPTEKTARRGRLVRILAFLARLIARKTEPDVASPVAPHPKRFKIIARILYNIL